MTITTYAAISVTSIAVPPLRDGIDTHDRFVAAIGLLEVRCYRGHRWRFKLQSKAIPAGVSETTLFDWLEKHLPRRCILIGWDIEDSIVGPLVEAAHACCDTKRVRFVARLAYLRRSAIELEMTSLARNRPTFAAACADAAIYAPAEHDAATLADWALGTTERLRGNAGDTALATWRLFLRSAGLAGLEAEEATEQWIRRHRRRSGVPIPEKPG